MLKPLHTPSEPRVTHKGVHNVVVKERFSKKVLLDFIVSRIDDIERKHGWKQGKGWSQLGPEYTLQDALDMGAYMELYDMWEGFHE
jgi:hypothetical protein